MPLRLIVAAVLAVLGLALLCATALQYRARRATGRTLALAISGATVALVAAAGVAQAG